MEAPKLPPILQGVNNARNRQWCRFSNGAITRNCHLPAGAIHFGVLPGFGPGYGI
jgi:hypothetical protein